MVIDIPLVDLGLRDCRNRYDDGTWGKRVGLWPLWTRDLLPCNRMGKLPSPPSKKRENMCWRTTVVAVVVIGLTIEL